MMLTEAKLRALEAVAVEGASSPMEVAQLLDVSLRQAQRLLSQLEAEGLVERERGRVRLARTQHALALAKLLARGLEWGSPASLLLTRSGMRVALAAPRPLDLGQVLRLSGLSRATFYRLLPAMVDSGWLLEVGPRLYVSFAWTQGGAGAGELAEVVRGYASFLASRFVRPGVVVLWTNGEEAVVRAEPGFSEGEPTAFSAFHRFGVPVLLPAAREYAVPRRELGPQEVFDHACLLAEDRRLKALCLKFYARNRRSLAKHEAFERMLRGREVEGWPTLEEAEVGVVF